MFFPISIVVVLLNIEVNKSTVKKKKKDEESPITLYDFNRRRSTYKMAARPCHSLQRIILGLSDLVFC